MANFKSKIKILIWKNLRLRRHKLLTTIFEIAYSFSFLLLLYFIQPAMKKVSEDKTKYFPIESEASKVPHLFYAPRNTYINNVMESAKAVVTPDGEFRGFDTEADMLYYMFHDKKKEGLAVGVVFDNVHDDSLPRNLNYRIRAERPLINIESLYEEFNPEYVYYFHSHFFPVQQAVDSAFIKQHKNLDFSISWQKMPMLPQTEEVHIITKMYISMHIVFGFIAFMQLTTQNILEEKSTGMTELEKIMGLQPWMLWLGWYIYSMFVLVPCVVGITAVIKSLMITQSDALIWALFLFVYCNSMLFYIFFITTLFNKPILGSSAALIIWILTYFPITYLSKDDANQFLVIRYLLLIFPNTCLYNGVHTIIEFETIENGLHWSMLFQVPNEYKMFHSIGTMVLVLLLESVILALLAWYVEAVNPGQYGIPKHCKFFLQKKKQAAVVPASICDTRPEVEPPGPGLQATIQIRNLHKRFGKTSAVNGLSLDIYSNQITVLLGHNGAGKTTAMNIICGMLEPTSGTVVVNGYNVRTQIDSIRESLGLCPQHNVYIKTFSVQDHLMFFAMLKGMSVKEANRESLDYLQRLKMTTKAKVTPDKLSGGFQRRLSLGLALVGSTKVLILDEPTSGLDPENRREIWDILMSMRGSRTILITTHFMEEADVLGDRIAIMHMGQLQCYGTTMFLKKLYSAGYTLTILLRPKSDINKIIDTINTFVPRPKLKHVSENYVAFELPTNDTATLSNLFINLENKKENLGIINFGVSLTTMDDVFIKVCNIAEDVSEKVTTVNIVAKSESFTAELRPKYNSGAALVGQQFRALLVKRIQYHKHKWLMFLIAILLPTLFQIPLEGASLGFGTKSNVNILLNLGMYPIATSYYSSDKDTDKLAMYYEKAVRDQHSGPVRTEHVTQEILKAFETHKDRYENLVTAAELNSTGGKMVLNAMYHPKAIHSCAVSLNLISNALLKYAQDDDRATITVWNNPQQVMQLGMNTVGMFWEMYIPLGLTLLVCVLLIFHVDERVSGVKHLQIMFGVPRYLYWLSNYVFDMFVYVGALLGIVLIIVAFQDFMSYSTALLAFISVMISFGLAMFPFAYFFHYRPNGTSASNFLIFCWTLFCIILPVAFFIWELWANNMRQDVRQAVQYALLLVPHYAVSYSLHLLVPQAAQIRDWESNDKDIQCSITPELPCCVPDSQACRDFYNLYHGEIWLLYCLLFLLLDAVVYWAIFLYVDYGFLRISKKIKPQEEDLDSDVAKEAKRVNEQIDHLKRMAAASTGKDDCYHSHCVDVDVLLVSNLRKHFRSFPAVNGLTFGVKDSECFGLLGINGAGKTTTFRMLTGEIFPTTGTANILEYSLSKNKRMFMKQIGYCSQFGALNYQLTTRELLTFFTHLRGIPRDQTRNYVNMWIQEFDIMKYQNVQAENLSGGNKRKLSTAIALLGDPPIVMLDEPTSGVDPVARRNLWDILATRKGTGQAIVLTSHSMDECEALCDRLAIMVDGQMKCIGNIQHLKNKFGQGFTVLVKLKCAASGQSTSSDMQSSFDGQVAALKSVIENQYQCVLKDEHTGMLMYHITDTKVTLGRLFEFLEQLKQTREIIEDFAVSVTSLEQVFLFFAKERTPVISKI